MTISHEATGNGPDLLLVHAGVADSRMWARQVAELQAGHRVITLDLRGYGDTPSARKYSDAGDVLAVLEELGAKDVTAVGASFGGYVVQQVASRRPDLFARLVLICAPTDNVEPDDDLRALWTAEEALLEAGDVDGATDLMVRHWIGPEADDEARELLREMQKHAYAVQLAAGDVDNEEWPVEPEKLTVPVRLITGGHDYRFFTDCADYLAERLPGSERVHLPWAGHLPTLERPAEALTFAS
ncbi:pimeloyl-ACP methyl ester carboxylesterase [Kribbella aluminosa]|uniref:Pimeloyl-ACP methyl ester carboxylesterase n=1 Tax=Kribbella aluminosa TaxID=416017 RepID=A0ABS4UU35_9ACTN|nr:alpha/beta hydrolase [Kribbella aluminosa]MBP2355126.1 pimeloyl-ACP methyl ester carboxylesterase [Kribbella aluminosa]